MDHEHFLGRLERLDEVTLADALALYYDPEVVRTVLGRAEARGHDARVAISLDHPVEGPFIIVEQSGAFVTALGRGMAVDDLPIVPRATWAAVRRDSARLAESFAAAQALGRGRIDAAIREVLTRGPFVSREAMLALRAIAPVIKNCFFESWTESQRLLSAAFLRLCSRDQWRRLDDDIFAQIGLMSWTLGHTSVLLASSSLRSKMSANDRTITEAPGPSLLMMAGMIGPYARLLWFVGKLGAVFIDPLKHRFRMPHLDARSRVDAALGLGAIAHRFSKHRGEIKKVLTVGPDADRSHRAAGQVGMFFLDDRPTLLDSLRELGRSIWVRRASLRTVPDLCFQTPEEVPDDLALSAVAALEDDLWTHFERKVSILSTGLVGTACLEVEQLYMPARYTQHFSSFKEASRAKANLSRLRSELAPAGTVEVGPKPGRNASCPCGSGAKFKRCCGA